METEKITLIENDEVKTIAKDDKNKSEVIQNAQEIVFNVR